MTTKKIIIYIAGIIILTILLVLGFRAPKTSQKNTPPIAPETNNDLKVDANTGNIVEDFRGGGKQSYLFNGPINVTNEGGPVPVGYGRLIVGSQVTYASYEVTRVDASVEPLTI